MKLLVLITGLLAACFVSGQNVLPAVKDGRWFLIDTTGRLLKETDFSYIHTYDATGYTYFSRDGGIGLLDSIGNVIVEPVYADVVQHGNGYYKLFSEEGWITLHAKNVARTGDVSESFTYLSASWASIEKDSNLYIENLPTGKRWSVDSTIFYDVLSDHLHYWSIFDSIELLIDPAGNTMLSGEILFNDQNDVLHARAGKQHYVFDHYGAWPYRKITSVYFDREGVFIRNGNEGVLCGYDRSVIVRGDYDIIGDYNAHYFFATKMGLMTLIDKQTKRSIVPFRYEKIEERDSLTYVVYKEGNSGLVDLQFREIIPCRYTRFIQRGDLVYVFDDNYQGLYSLKRRTELIPPIYNTVVRTGNRFRAQRNELLSIIEIDEQHNILKTARIDNVLIVHQAVNGKRRRNIDPRLFTIGWYLDSILVQPSGKPAFYSTRWGLRGTNDSVLIRPKKFVLERTDLSYIPAAPYSVYYTGKQEYVYYTEKVEAHTYTPVYIPTGKFYPELLLFGFDSTDFRHRDFMRISTKEGFGVLHSDGSFQPLAYVEDSPNLYLRYCEAKKIVPATKKTEEMTEVPSLGFNGDFVPNPIVQGPMWMDIVGLQYPEGKWNYFGPDGKPLFREPFIFAHPFLGKQAIVKSEKGWGVISPDTLLVPAIYSHVQRQIAGRDTLFLVRRGRPGNLLLDTLANVLDITVEIVATGPHNFIIAKEGRKFLCDERLKEISEGYMSMKFLKNGLVLAKTKKEYTLINAEGTVLYGGNEEPEEIYFEKILVFKRGSGLTLCDLSLNTIAEGCSEIERQGTFVTVKKGGEWSVWNAELQPVLSGQEGQLLVDTITGQLAVVNNDRTTVYTGSGKRIARLKEMRAAYFIAGKLWVVKGDSCTTYETNGQPATIFHGFQSLEVLANGDLFLKIRRGNNRLFHRDWTPVLPEEARFRSLTLLASGIYSFQSAGGKTVLYNNSTGRIDTTHRLMAGECFHGDRLLVLKGSTYQYIDRDFQPLTKVRFSQATSFKGNYAAAGDKRGWTLIDRNCRPLGYPYDGRITQLNELFFQTPKPPFYGVFDSTGKELIPVIYEQVELLPNGIILCVKEGDLFYFRKNGTPLLR